MKILVDIGHPAHVHLFKNFARIMTIRGHQVHFTARDKEFEIYLLIHENLLFTNLGRHYRSKRGKIWGLVKYNWEILMISIGYKPDLYLSHGSIYTLLSSFLLRKPNIALEDSGNYEQVRLYLPFTSAVLTSTSFPYRYGEKQIFYDGYHELAYLHPNYFTPDPKVRDELGISEGQKYFIVRFVSWDASHDIGHSGLTYEQKKEIVVLLSSYGQVFITSEAEIPPEFESFRFPLRPERMHHVLAFAHLFVGEGATMASECAVLGTTAIYVNSIQRGYILEQEHNYGLVYNFRNGDGVTKKITELINDHNLKENSIRMCKKLLQDMIDVTAFMVWFVETYPKSKLELKRNSEVFTKFR